jgi:hypothetical protein
MCIGQYAIPGDHESCPGDFARIRFVPRPIKVRVALCDTQLDHGSFDIRDTRIVGV